MRPDHQDFVGALRLAAIAAVAAVATAAFVIGAGRALLPEPPPPPPLQSR